MVTPNFRNLVGAYEEMLADRDIIGLAALPIGLGFGAAASAVSQIIAMSMNDGQVLPGDPADSVAGTVAHWAVVLGFGALAVTSGGRMGLFAAVVSLGAFITGAGRVQQSIEKAKEESAQAAQELVAGSPTAAALPR